MGVSGSGRPWWGARHAIAFWALLGVYALVTLGVIFSSPILRLDTDLFRLDLRHRYPEWKPWIHLAVMFGQRGPATLVFLPVFLWVAWRRRSARPLLMLVTSLILLNLSVGIVKLATGRIGPLQTSKARDVFVGGDIYPSGHVSNAVVLYGLLAMIAVAHRKLVISVAAVLSVEVGLSTVYLDTHWFSDVIGGWIAGGLVLLSLPWAMPFTERVWARTWTWLRPRVVPHAPQWLRAWVLAHPPARPGGSGAVSDTHAIDTGAATDTRAADTDATDTHATDTHATDTDRPDTPGADPPGADAPGADAPGADPGAVSDTRVADGRAADPPPARSVASRPAGVVAGWTTADAPRAAGQAAARSGNGTPVSSSASAQRRVAT